MNNKSIHYFLMQIDVKGNTYSVDNLITKTVIKVKDYDKFLIYLFDNFKLSSVDNSKAHYRYRFEKEFNESTLRVEIDLNSIDKYKAKITVNPNKCFQDKKCLDFIVYVASISSSFKIDQIDLAMDIKVEKSLVHFMKYRKNVHYKDYSDSKLKNNPNMPKDILDNNQNFVYETFGTRNHKTIDGWCKLYFKTAETEIDDIVTRLEMTLKVKNHNLKWLLKKYVKKFPPTFIMHLFTDLSEYEGNKTYEKYKDIIKVLNQSCNPYQVIQTIISPRTKTVYDKRTQKNILSLLDMEMVRPCEKSVKKLLKDFSDYIEVLQKLELKKDKAHIKDTRMFINLLNQKNVSVDEDMVLAYDKYLDEVVDNNHYFKSCFVNLSHCLI